MFLIKNKSLKKVSIFMLFMAFSIFALNISGSYAEPIEIRPRAFDCGQCGTYVVNTTEKILSRTDMSGSRCSYCTRSSSHKTDVYTVRKVLKCSKGCTYSIIENMPTEYRCKSF